MLPQHMCCLLPSVEGERGEGIWGWGAFQELLSGRPCAGRRGAGGVT